MRNNNFEKQIDNYLSDFNSRHQIQDTEVSSDEPTTTTQSPKQTNCFKKFFTYLKNFFNFSKYN